MKQIVRMFVAAIAVLVAVSVKADVVSWVGPAGVQDWNQSTNWSSGVVPTGDATVFFPLVSKNYYFEVTPSDLFTGTIVSSNYYNLVENAYASRYFTPILKLGGAAEAQWTVSGNGDLVATDGLAARLSNEFTGQIDVRKGTVFTAPATLATNVWLVGAGRLVLASPSQLKQAAAFAGEIALPSGDPTCTSSSLFTGHALELANGQTLTLDAHDILNGQVGTIPAFADEPTAWSYNGTAWTNGTLSSGPFSTAPPHLDTDGSLLLTDDPAQLHTVFFTNRTFNASDEWGYSFLWSPELPADSRIVQDGRGQTIAGTFSICFQRVSPTNVKTGKDRTNHGTRLHGFYLYPYAGDGKPFVAWIYDGNVGSSDYLHEDQLNGISLRQPIDFTVSVIGMRMTVTMVQGTNSVSVSHNFGTSLSVRCVNSIWVGLGGATDEWGSNHIIPWVRHRISNFSGWYRDQLGGGWQDVPSANSFSTFNADNWYMLRKSYATGTEVVKEDNACVNADGTVTLCDPTASNMTYLVCKQPLNPPHTKRIKVSYKIQGGAAYYPNSGNTPMRMGFLFGSKNAVTWNSNWIYTSYAFDDWLYGYAFNLNLNEGVGNFVASKMSAETISNDGKRYGPSVGWVTRADTSRRNLNQTMDFDFLYDPIGRVSGLFATRAASTSENGQFKRVNWDIPTDYLPYFEYWKANRKPYVGIRVASGTTSYTEMTLKSLRVQQMDTAEAGRMSGTVRVPAGNSATLAAGEKMAGQMTRVVTAAKVELGAGSSLTVSPSTNNATIVGIESVTASGAGTLVAASGATVEVEDLVLTGAAGQASLTTGGNVSFPAVITVTIPDEWQDSGDRLVLVDGSSAAGSLPVTTRIVTATGTDVTDKAHFLVQNGVASICFASGTVIIVR